MDVKDCLRGFYTPDFHDTLDLDGIRKAFYRDGMVFLQNCDEDKLVALGENLGTIARPRNELAGGRGVSNIRCAPGLEGKGYSNQELFFHTDRSGWDEPPRLLMTTLKVKSETGGESALVDTRQALDYIRQHEPLLYSLITCAKYSSFKADNGTFQPRPIYDEKTDIVRFRFDDGIQMSASLVENFKKLSDIVYKHAFAVSLEPGQCYIVDNHRFLHGRTSFTGSRELLRVLAWPHAAEADMFVLFDVDGTLCRSEDLSIDAYYRCVSDITGKDINNENTDINLHGVTDRSLLRAILSYHGFGEDEIQPLMTKFFELHPSYLRESLGKGFTSIACPQVSEALKWLPQQRDKFGRRVSIGLLTGNSRENALLKISAAGLPTDIFDLEISSFGDAHEHRSALVLDSIRKMQARHGIPVAPSDVTIVGDTPLDIQCAKETGCRVVAVATGNYETEKLESYAPDFLCKRLPEASPFFTQVLSF
ncbi:putative haloacid dehalogenase-like hydrolase [Pseudovirgaria hyperparasitica]|uniref:Putative haloacid dehalogenase-like hydrolase n=1 Tax=Pseudovirgaria hyperparasitica TaxID=470096 RepID=A0A6A6VQ37_9PEZI|nr:putative haloacid dehalogenase-like hydrolase [Pseudovirgaria hyperparasitica]KAF2752732.1 putative haloacid dehalogenase-like hydrolase [Pseudovirgaria hyperparasitica]